MLRLYCGEYMKAPAGLHMMMNPCSHGCYYCFAKLAGTKGMDFDAIYREFAKLEGDPGKSITKYLYQKNMPICVSNTTDPFCASNAQGFSELSEWMTEKDINFILQTRGGVGFEEVIRKIKPTMIYFSVTSDRDDILKTREPGTPSFTERMEFLRVAKQAGHFIVLGLNPYVPEWWSDVRGFADSILDMGIDHIWTELLHLTPMQHQGMSSGVKTRFEAEIANGMARKNPDRPQHEALVRMLDNMGFNVLSSNRSTKLHFWDDFFKLGYPFMPTLDGFISHCVDKSNDDPIRFTFDYFHKWANIFGDFESSQFHEYLKPFRRTLYKNGISENIKTSKEVHELYWDILDYPTPLRCDDMSYSFISLEESKEEAEFDSEGRPILVVARGWDDIGIERAGLALLDIK